MHVLILVLIAALAVLLAVSFGVIDALHVQPRPRAGQKRVACVGDSITYGCFVPGQPWNSYPRQLGRMLGRGSCVGNFGYTNRTALKSGSSLHGGEALPAEPCFSAGHRAAYAGHQRHQGRQLERGGLRP